MKTFEQYPKTDKFQVVETIGVPHPYCITPKHVEYAADHCSGMLTEYAMEQAEKFGAVCDICRRSGKGILSYADHKQALVIEVADDRELQDIPELHPYLLSIKALAEAEGYAGFAFKQAKVPV